MTRRTTLPGGRARAPGPAARRAPTARTEAAQTVAVTLGWQLAAGCLTLTATTPRRGGSYHDSWSVSPSLALMSVTVADACVPRPPSYTSRAVVGESSLLPDTTYTFSYAIVMRGGASTWAGSRSLTVTVDPDGLLTEVARRNSQTRP